MPAFIDILKVEKVRGERSVSKDVSIIETPGHTPGSISVIVETQRGRVILVGDGVMCKDDFLKHKAPRPCVDPKLAIESVRKIEKFKPDLIVPGHDKPFHPSL